MKRILTIIIICIAFYQWATDKNNSTITGNNSTQSVTNNISPNTNHTIELAYKNKQSDVQVTGSGTVIKLLRDDNEGSRHQKFILRLSSGQTITIAHNIDLAARINSISKGDQVQFNGEYEWNNKGGVVHWTHHDPRGKHVDGWLKHKSKIYQ